MFKLEEFMVFEDKDGRKGILIKHRNRGGDWWKCFGDGCGQVFTEDINDPHYKNIFRLYKSVMEGYTQFDALTFMQTGKLSNFKCVYNRVEYEKAKKEIHITPEIFQKIKELSILEKKSLEQMGLKLSEETGECTQALLSYVGASGCTYKELGIEDVEEECVDVIVVALSLFYKLGGHEKSLVDILNEKIKKWEEKQDEICIK